jgi:heme/copper-type cytochrome/quinol oxidase subunit 2
MLSTTKSKAASLLEKTNLTVLALIGIFIPILLLFVLFLALKRKKEVAAFEMEYRHEIEADPELIAAFELANKRIKGAIIIPTVIFGAGLLMFLAQALSNP